MFKASISPLMFCPGGGELKLRRLKTAESIILAGGRREVSCGSTLTSWSMGRWFRPTSINLSNWARASRPFLWPLPFSLLPFLVASLRIVYCKWVNENLVINHEILLACGHCSPPLHLLSSSNRALSPSAVAPYGTRKRRILQYAVEPAAW